MPRPGRRAAGRGRRHQLRLLRGDGRRGGHRARPAGQLPRRPGRGPRQGHAAGPARRGRGQGAAVHGGRLGRGGPGRGGGGDRLPRGRQTGHRQRQPRRAAVRGPRADSRTRPGPAVPRVRRTRPARAAPGHGRGVRERRGVLGRGSRRHRGRDHRQAPRRATPVRRDRARLPRRPRPGRAEGRHRDGRGGRTGARHRPRPCPRGAAPRPRGSGPDRGQPRLAGGWIPGWCGRRPAPT